MKAKYIVTAFELVPVSRTYIAEDEEQAIDMMAAWIDGQESNGRQFNDNYSADFVSDE